MQNSTTLGLFQSPPPLIMGKRFSRQSWLRQFVNRKETPELLKSFHSSRQDNPTQHQDACSHCVAYNLGCKVCREMCKWWQMNIVWELALEPCGYANLSLCHKFFHKTGQSFRTESRFFQNVRCALHQMCGVLQNKHSLAWGRKVWLLGTGPKDCLT